MPLRRCRWFSFRLPPALPRTSLAASPPGPNLQLSSSALPGGAALGSDARLSPCTLSSGPASDRVRARPLGPCLRLSSPVLPLRRLPSGLAHANPSALPRTGLQLASPPGPSELNLRLLIASAILRLPSLPWLRLAPLPWPFRFRLQTSLAALPPALPSGCVSAPGLRPSLPLNPPAAFQPAFRPGLAPCVFPLPSSQPSGLLPPALRLSPLHPLEACPPVCRPFSHPRSACALRLQPTVSACRLSGLRHPVDPAASAFRLVLCVSACASRLVLQPSGPDLRALDSSGLRPLKSALRP
jgi:hypothetical protein